jgi:hypothetical protein
MEPELAAVVPEAELKETVLDSGDAVEDDLPCPRALNLSSLFSICKLGGPIVE